MLGTFTGLGFAVMFGLLAQWLVKVDGMRMGEYVDALLQLKQKGTPIQLSGLLIGGMIISTLGAVMDVAMSISSAAKRHNSACSAVLIKVSYKSFFSWMCSAFLSGMSKSQHTHYTASLGQPDLIKISSNLWLVPAVF